MHGKPVRIGVSRLMNLRSDVMAARAIMEVERERFATMSGQAPTAAITSFNLFQTPVGVASETVEMLGDTRDKRVLEPSAGLGRLAKQVNSTSLVMVDISKECCDALSALYIGEVINRDFLSCSPSELGLFDCIVMNPPFKMGTDIKHIMHAKTFLVEGGLLVSLCFNGTKQNNKLKPLCDTWEVLPESSFKSEGTTASVARVTIRN